MCTGNEQPIDNRDSVPIRECAYDLVAIDIDGTLLTSESKLSAAAVPLIAETQARGTGVTLVSGRSKMKVTPLLEALGLTLPYISSGGAHIVDPSNNLVIFYRALAREETVEIVQ